MFKVGDKVVFCKSSLESGMIDSKEGDVFTVNGVYNRTVSLKELPGDYHKSHFEHYVEKEKVMEKYIPKVGDKAKGFKFDGDSYPVMGYAASMDDVVGKQGTVSSVSEGRFVIDFGDNRWRYPLELAHLAKIEDSPQEISNEDSQIDWQGSQINWQVGQVGQVVWDIMYGKGEVVSIASVTGTIYPVEVCFDKSRDEGVWFTLDGKCYEDCNRTLFFSEPKIIAETKPPKKPFTPVFYKGDTLVAKKKDGQDTVVFYVDKETELSVESTGCGYPKALYNFYKLGEQVKFS